MFPSHSVLLEWDFPEIVTISLISSKNEMLMIQLVMKTFLGLRVTEGSPWIVSEHVSSIGMGFS